MNTNIYTTSTQTLALMRMSSVTHNWLQVIRKGDPMLEQYPEAIFIDNCQYTDLWDEQGRPKFVSYENRILKGQYFNPFLSTKRKNTEEGSESKRVFID